MTTPPKTDSATVGRLIIEKWGVDKNHESYIIREIDTAIAEERQRYNKLKEFVRGKWKGDCSECAAIANSVLNQEASDMKG